MRVMVLVEATEASELEAADLAGFVSPGELAAPRDGARGQLGVA